MKGAQAEASVYRHMGDNELKKGNYRLAISQYLYSLEIVSEQPDVNVNLGVAYLRLGDLDRARIALDRASRMETTTDLRSLIALHQGEVSERMDRKEEAIRFYDEALREGARPVPVYQKLGGLYVREQDFDRAREAFETILQEQTDPGFPYREMLRRSRGRAKDDPEIVGWLESEAAQGLTKEDWERYDAVSIERMHASDPEIAKTHNHLGLIFYRLGDIEASISHFEQSLAIWPGNQDATRNLRFLRSERVKTGS
jgi:tetratricopeptide (TPR) repeat protein